MKKYKSKWQVLVAYNINGNDYIIFCRKNKKTGMLYFKTKRVGVPFTSSFNFIKELVDIQTQFNKIISEES